MTNVPQNNLNKFQDIFASADLSTYDPYDIWKTDPGVYVKDLFNKNKFVASIPALALSLADQFLNPTLRRVYTKQEYPIVRALAAQIALNRFLQTKEQQFLRVAEMHLKWLTDNRSVGYSGACWGLGFKWPAASGVIYDRNTPHATHTPYAVEAMHRYTEATKNQQFEETIRSCFAFLENDLYVMYEDDSMMATSYGPFKDRIVTNAVSYTMYMYAILKSYLPLRSGYIDQKIEKLYNFILTKQLPDGSWLYVPDDENSFIDCFHTCFIIKNIIKTSKTVNLNRWKPLVERAYTFLCDKFYDPKSGLYKRFAKANKLSLTKFDLYDNAEMLNITNMMGDYERNKKLGIAVTEHFVRNNGIYSVRLWKKDGVRDRLAVMRLAVLK